MDSNTFTTVPTPEQTEAWMLARMVTPEEIEKVLRKFDVDSLKKALNAMTEPRKNITQPPDWWLAFQKAADAEGVSLSEWLGEAGKKRLPKSVQKSLSPRNPAHRPVRR